MYQKEQLHTIQQLSTKLNIPKPTLRFWEKEFEGILIPLRTNGGQRRYTSEHVTVIGEIKALKKAGLSLVEIKRKLGKGQMSETGGEMSGDRQTGGVDFLADRVAEGLQTLFPKSAVLVWGYLAWC
jgi:DNA-binding transcriptional MerR regulator